MLLYTRPRTGTKANLESVRHFELKIPVGPHGQESLEADLALPERAVGAVIFAHGAGSGRKSPRNAFVAKTLQQTGLATLLFDLDVKHADEKYDVERQGRRVIEATRWLRAEHVLDHTPIGYFGASTGAGAALYAASELGRDIAAVVCRGGRVDLAQDRIRKITCPTLFIVGGEDTSTQKDNKRVFEKLKCEKDFETIPGARHLFEEAGALEAVSHLSADWFLESFGVLEEVG